MMALPAQACVVGMSGQSVPDAHSKYALLFTLAE
jgi:hypothetical protein